MMLSKPPSQRFHKSAVAFEKDPLKRFTPGPTSQTQFEGPRAYVPKGHLTLESLNKAVGLMAVHYSKMADQEKMKEKYIQRLPEKPKAAIPGYGGFIPRKEAMNVLGCTYAKGNAVSMAMYDAMAELRGEQMAARTRSRPNTAPGGNLRVTMSRDA